MTDEKVEPKVQKPSAPKKKRPTLSEKVKSQKEIIDNLNLDLQKKEQQVSILVEESRRNKSLADKEKKLAEELNAKLKEIQKSMSVETEKAKKQNQLIEFLKEKLSTKKEIKTAHTEEQDQLIKDLSGKILEVEIQLAETSIQNKRVTAENTVKKHMIAGMTLGLLPAPLLDIAALSGVQLSLLRSLSTHYDVGFNEQLGKTVITSLVSGSLPVLTVVGLGSCIKIVPGIGTLGGGIGMTVTSGAMIYATGQVFIKHFEAGGTIQDFDAKYWKTFFRAQLKNGKNIIKNNQDEKNAYPSTEASNSLKQSEPLRESVNSA